MRLGKDKRFGKYKVGYFIRRVKALRLSCVRRANCSTARLVKTKNKIKRLDELINYLKGLNPSILVSKRQLEKKFKTDL